MTDFVLALILIMFVGIGAVVLVEAFLGSSTAEGPGGPTRGPRPLLRITTGVALMAAGAAMTAGQLNRWHTCLGWRWSSAETTCGAIQDYTWSKRFPGTSIWQGIGFLLLAVALASALTATAAQRRDTGTPERSGWARIRAVGIAALGAVAAALFTLGGLAYVGVSVTGGGYAAAAILFDPLLFAALAVLLAADGRFSGVRPGWWDRRLVRLFAGLAMTNFLLEYLFWSLIIDAYDTPPFTGQLRALLLVFGGWMMSVPRTKRGHQETFSQAK
ncbi:hypothetical protein [Pseudonocardia spinosispora]|uniref:hypothetical protein n=1 Tax=Pseudonocardia spinosispora TaxID=103441 RepID=UPI0012EBF409|nr:hypothetical protein [Pseudonocardia spinosispora]